jgi:hypothetical protein
MNAGQIFLLSALIVTLIMFVLNFFIDFEGFKMALYVFTFACLTIFLIAFPANCR